MRAVLLVSLAILASIACSEGVSSGDVDPADIAREIDVALEVDVVEDVLDDAGVDLLADVAQPPDFVAVTFNTGTGPELAHNRGSDGYTSAEAAITDEWYGNGLNWPAFIEETRAWFAEVDPDIVGFQEIFYTGECPDIPSEAQQGFVCEEWSPGDPPVAQTLLGEGWQVACHPGQSDKCVAVNRRFGTLRGCDGDFCLEGLDGFRIEGCGSGARVGRAVIERVDGGEITLVHIHGSSGGERDDRQCRVRQIEQVFVDLGDGQPGANGERNLVIGDFNTDPGRVASSDESAAHWNDFVGEGLAFHWVTDIGLGADETYLGLGNIDHVVSDVFEGSCWAAGVTEGRPPVLDAVFFDHTPIVCNLLE